MIGIDRYHPPHTLGSSHGETRITRMATAEGRAIVPFVMRSHQIWRDLEEEWGDSLLTETGLLVLTSVERDPGGTTREALAYAQRSAEVARNFKIPHEVLNTNEIERRFPQFRLSSEHVGYFEPSGGFVRPEAAIRAQLGTAERLGATLRFDEHVLRLEVRSSTVVVHTNKGTYEASNAVVSAGPYLGQLLPGPLFATDTVFRVYRQVLHWFPVQADEPFEIGRFPVFIWNFGAGPNDSFYGFPAAERGAGSIKVATERY